MNIKYFKQILKALITILALYFVFSKIEWLEIKGLLSDINPWWFLLAFLFFNASKVLSFFRIDIFYRMIGIKLDLRTNFRLYYVGMFYNLFLPSAIGGDAYKVYLLKQSNKSITTKDLVLCALTDRLSGLLALLMLGLIFLFAGSVGFNLVWSTIILLLIVGATPLFYVFLRFFLKKFSQDYKKTTLCSVGVQLMQAIAVIFILLGFRADGQYLDYLSLFMLSSAICIIPFTIGGVGARELVFLYGHGYLGIDKEISILLTLSFFTINFLSSLIGLYFSLNDNRLFKSEFSV